MKEYSRAEVAKHNCRDDIWIIVDDKVFDLTKFLKLHPGSQQPLLEFAGQDATDIFYSQHRRSVLYKYLDQLCIGELPDSEVKTRLPAEELISPISFTELNHWHGLYSPYYDNTHKEFQTRLRAWLRENVQEEMESYEIRGKTIKRSLVRKFGSQGLIAFLSGMWKEIPGSTTLGIPAEELNMFHEAICQMEVGYLNTPGALDGSSGGSAIGIPPVVMHGNAELFEEIVRPVLSGQKTACLAITEPYVGSDVAGLRCTATLTEDGEYFIVNGVKKWITAGINADFYTTAVRTGGPGHRGVSCLCIPKECGVKARKIKVMTYSPCAGTALVEYDNVKVPKKYLIGELNKGFKVIMANFNHERWLICLRLIGALRRVINECIRWASQRKVFGKALISEPVIRGKLGYMISRLEAIQQLGDNLTFQMDKMNHREQYKYLGGPTALFKVATTQMGEYVTSEACQIFGGRGITHGGMGTVIQRTRAVVKNATIYGGSEEIMADLAVRQALKSMKGYDAKL